MQQLPLPHLIAERARETPDRLFIQEIGGVEQTYSEFHRDGLAWASALESAGVSEGDVVATMLPASALGYHCWMGLSWLRAIEVPVNHEYRRRMLKHVLENSKASCLVVSKLFLDEVLEVLDQLTYLQTMVVPDATEGVRSCPVRVVLGDELAARRLPVDREPPERWDTAAIIYTSGTTGASKGVVCSWAQLAETVLFPADEAELCDDGGYYSPWQPFHLTGRTAAEIAVRLKLRLIVRERFSISSFWSDVRTYRCTHFYSAFIGAWLWRQPAREDDAQNPLVRMAMVPLIPQYREFETRFGVKLSTSYASVESGFPIEPTHDPKDYRTCGRVRTGYDVRLVDVHDEEVPVGEVGEMVVRSDRPWQSFGGYFNNPEATAAVLGNAWFHTGDGFRMDEAGDLYFSDRLKDYLKYRGKTVSAAEVEQAVEEHPAVIECACVGVPSDLAVEGVVGGDDIRVFVVLDNNSNVAPPDLASFLMESVPRFMVPRYIDIVDSIPKNHLHKAKKQELREVGINAATWDRSAAGM